jgi:hypothetical protein
VEGREASHQGELTYQVRDSKISAHFAEVF